MDRGGGTVRPIAILFSRYSRENGVRTRYATRIVSPLLHGGDLSAPAGSPSRSGREVMSRYVGSRLLRCITPDLLIGGLLFGSWPGVFPRLAPDLSSSNRHRGNGFVRGGGGVEVIPLSIMVWGCGISTPVGRAVRGHSQGLSSGENGGTVSVSIGGGTVAILGRGRVASLV